MKYNIVSSWKQIFEMTFRFCGKQFDIKQNSKCVTFRFGLAICIRMFLHLH